MCILEYSDGDVHDGAVRYLSIEPIMMMLMLMLLVIMMVMMVMVLTIMLMKMMFTMVQCGIYQ